MYGQSCTASTLADLKWSRDLWDSSRSIPTNRIRAGNLIKFRDSVPDLQFIAC